MENDEMNNMAQLVIAAVANFVIAAIQIVFPVTGPRGHIYFGTDAFLALESKSAVFPDLISWVLAIIFFIFGLYCLSGAELFRPLPYSSAVVWMIGGAYTLRGLVFFPLIFDLYPATEHFTSLFTSSILSLVIGILILRGMKSRKVSAHAESNSQP